MEAKKNGKLTMNHSNNPKSTSSGKGDSEQLFERYEHIRRIAFQNTLRLHFKRAAWVTVVRTTLLAKRLIDIIASVLLLMLLSPVFLACAIAIRRDSPGPIFFKQTRVGRWGKLFPMWKFRSMYMDAEARKKELEKLN